MRSIEGQLENGEATPGGAPGTRSSADDIAASVESLGDRIEASVQAALAKKGLDKRSS